MITKPFSFLLLRLGIAAASLILVVSLSVPVAHGQAVFAGETGQGTTRLSLPVIYVNALPAGEQLCRLGIGGTQNIAAYPVRPLRLAWYVDWGARAQPARPNGIGYLPMVRLSQIGPDAYTSTPSLADLPALVGESRGAVWVIGNEPDRPIWQDDLSPEVYAHAYHDIYGIIKQADPAARVAIAGIVQPSPLRLQYLDMVLQAYETRYGKAADGTSMPIDVWTVHAFILNEKSCDVYPTDCWGAEIPRGVPGTIGLDLRLEDHGRLDIFQGFITSFRSWMQQRGYRNRPLLLTEFGILMPADYANGAFTPDKVQAYMQDTFSFLATANGPTGYPADDGRLVQGWAWFSLDDMQSNDLPSNGALFNALSGQRTVFGDKFVALASQMAGDVNLKPLAATATRVGTGSAARVELSLTVANSGNARLPAAVNVRFYRGNPASSGTPVATDAWLYSLDGCGGTMTISSVWTDAPATTETLWAVVDPLNMVSERNEADNSLSFTLPPS